MVHYHVHRVSLTDCFPNKKETAGRGQVSSDAGSGKRKIEGGEASLVWGHMGSSGQLELSAWMVWGRGRATSCVIMGRSLYLSESEFPICGDNHTDQS